MVSWLLRALTTENGQLCLQRYFYTGSSWEKRRSCHWSEEVSRGPEVISVYGKVLSKTQRICQRMSTSQVQRCYTHFCIHWPLKIVTCPNWHAAAKGYYISKPQCQKSISAVTLNFWKCNHQKNVNVKLILKLIYHVVVVLKSIINSSDNGF